MNFFYLIYFAACGKNFLIYGVFYIPIKCIESVDFYSCPSFSLKNSGRIVWKFVSFQDKKGGENYDLVYQNLIRKYEDDLEH